MNRKKGFYFTDPGVLELLRIYIVSNSSQNYAFSQKRYKFQSNLPWTGSNNLSPIFFYI